LNFMVYVFCFRSDPAPGAKPELPEMSLVFRQLAKI